MPNPSRSSVDASGPQGRALDLPDRGTTWVYDLGDPHDPVVLLLHGWTASAALNWSRAMRPLVEAGYRVVALDHRGHGHGIRTDEAFRLEDCADDAAAVCAELRIGEATVVGYSMGGPIAQLTWRRHRDLVSGLVLCATAPVFRGRRGEAALFGVMGGLARAARRAPEHWQRQIHDRVIDRRFDPVSMAAWAEEEMRGHSPRLLIEAGQAIGRYDARDWIGEVDVPTAVIVTERDHVVPAARQELLVDAIDGASRWTVDADHDVVAMKPALFNPKLFHALDDVVSRASGRRLDAALGA